MYFSILTRVSALTWYMSLWEIWLLETEEKDVFTILGEVGGGLKVTLSELNKMP